jgi:hypothetical protein
MTILIFGVLHKKRRMQAIITIRNGLANLSLVGILEISLAATLVELIHHGT